MVRQLIVAALELKFGGLLDRDIARLRALKNHTHIVGSTSLKGRKTMSAAQARRCRGAPIY
jgi:hypothetical protein